MTATLEENLSSVAIPPQTKEGKSVAAEEENEEEEVELLMPEPPDGGWGWVIVFCSFMIHVIADGVTYTFGIFYVEFLRYFGESKGATSWVASIMVGTTFCVGPFASGLTNQFGCRTVTIIGSLLATFGLIISTMAPNIVFLYFSIGICTGTGFGLMYLPAIVCVTCYFDKKRAFATGIAVCGSGIGTSVLAPLIEWMVSEYGWQGAMLVTAGMVLNCCLFGALFRPLQKKPVVRRMTHSSMALNHVIPCNGNGYLRKGSLPNGTIGKNGEICLSPLKTDDCGRPQSASMLGINHQYRHSVTSHEIHNATSMTLSTTSSRRSSIRFRGGPLARKDIFYSGNIPHADSNLYIYDIQPEDAEKENTVHRAKKTRIFNCICPQVMREAFQEMMNFSLMRDVIFLMFGFSNFFTNIGFNVPYVYTKDRAIGLSIADEAYASFLLSIIGIANTIGRVVLGYLSDRSFINRLWLYNGSLTICGFATIFSSLCQSYNLMALYATVFGATAGAYVSLTSVILVDLLGLEKLTNAFGLLLLFEGIACLIGPPITGWLHDYTGSYDPGFYASGFMIAISGLMLFFIPCVKKSLTINQKSPSNIDSSSPLDNPQQDNCSSAQV